MLDLPNVGRFVDKESEELCNDSGSCLNFFIAPSARLLLPPPGFAPLTLDSSCSSYFFDNHRSSKFSFRDARGRCSNSKYNNVELLMMIVQ